MKNQNIGKNKKNASPIHVFSECSKLKTVLVHRPGKELYWITPETQERYLFSNILNDETAANEHDAYVQILKENGVDVIYAKDFFAAAWKVASKKAKEEFVDKFLRECLLLPTAWDKVKKHLLKKKTGQEVFLCAVEGMTEEELGISKKHDILVTEPMPNMYFTRDPFSCVYDGVIVSKMKHNIRRPENLFGEFVFKYHPIYKKALTYIKRDHSALLSIEGGDVFPYNKDTLVIGCSERTLFDSILEVAKNIKKDKNADVKQIVSIRVPHLPNLMHLDTWLTMADKNKFIYSPNMLSELECYWIDLTADQINIKEFKGGLSDILEKIIGEKPVLIPVAGNYSKLAVDVETNFDATNFLAIAPGVVVGYDRNYRTVEALRKAGVRVYTFKGNQLSLGMGSTRCMSMPLERE